MTLHQLQIFIVVATRLNLREASEDLRIAQPALSHQLRLLQDELGQPTHRKIGTGIALTPAGELLLREAKVILSRVTGLKDKLASNVDRASNPSLTVGGSYNPCAKVLPAALAAFRRRHPDAPLLLKMDRRLAIEKMILKGELEIALVNNPPSYRQLTGEVFRPESLIAFVSSDHPLAKKRRLTKQDMKDAGFITRQPPGPKGRVVTLVQALRKMGFSMDVVMQCDSPDSVKGAVRRKMGVGILYKDVLENNIRNGEFVALKLPLDGFALKSYLIYHKMRPLSPYAQEFRQLLKEQRDK